MNNQQHFLWVALLSTVVWGGVMFWEVSVFKTDCASRYGFKTILVDGACSMASRLAELELARDASRFENIILQGHAPGSETAVTNGGTLRSSVSTPAWIVSSSPYIGGHLFFWPCGTEVGSAVP